MIANETIKVTRPDAAPLFLASFNEADLAGRMPVDPHSLPYEPTNVHQSFAQPPGEFILAASQNEHFRSWGIYEGTPSPDSFVGLIDLCQENYGEPGAPEYSKTMQRIGTTILAINKRGRGIGTIAKLAVIRFALETDGTHAFASETSERNAVAQRSLGKTGFTHLDTYDRHEFPGGEQTQHWMLADPRAQEALSSSDDLTDTERHALAIGWQRYTSAVQDIAVKIRRNT